MKEIVIPAALAQLMINYLTSQAPVQLFRELHAIIEKQLKENAVEEAKKAD